MAYKFSNFVLSDMYFALEVIRQLRNINRRFTYLYHMLPARCLPLRSSHKLLCCLYTTVIRRKIGFICSDSYAVYTVIMLRAIDGSARSIDKHRSEI